MSILKPKTPEERAEHIQRGLRHLARRMAAPGADSILSTSILDRGRIFQPSSEPRVLDTWTMPDVVPHVCTTQIRGRLGQMHAAVLESALLRRTAEQDEADGGKTLTVPMSALLADLSAVRTYSCATLERLLDDLVSARVRLIGFGRTWGAYYMGRPAPDVVDGTLLARWSRTTMTGTAHGVIRDRVTLALTLSPAYLTLLRHDRAPSGKRERLAIVHLRDGRSRATARWLLSQNPGRQPAGGWMLDGVLEAVLGLRTPQQLMRDRAALREEAPEFWMACGVTFSRDRTDGKRQTPNRVALLKDPQQAHQRQGDTQAHKRA